MNILNSSGSKCFHRALFLLIFFLIQPYQAKAENPDVGVFWKVPFLPFSLHLGADGVKVQGETSIVTPIGAFGIDASVPVIEKPKPTLINNIQVEKNDLLLVIRNTNQWGDKIYKITDGNDISVFTDGSTMISAKNGNVIIDVSNGNVHEINFAGKTEISGTDSGQQLSNLTLPVELKLWYQDKTDNLFKPLSQGGTLHSGDLYKLVFRTSEDSYVYIFNTDNTGKFVRLFPMKAFKDVAVNNFNPVKADKSCYIPSTEKSFKLDTNTGTGKIFYFAVKNPDPKLDNTDFEQGESAAVLNYLKSVCRDCISVITFTHK